MLERFSHSSIQTYKKCPAQFKFRYIDKIHKKDEGIEAFLGKRVHESIEYLYERVKSGFTPFVDEILKVHRSLWKEKWHRRIAIFYDHKSPRDYFSLGEKCIARYYRNYYPFNDNVISNEHEIVFLLDDDPAYKIKGIVSKSLEKTKELLNYNIIGDDDNLSKLRKTYEYAFIGIGQIKTPNIRIAMFNRLKNLNFKLPSIISFKSNFSTNAIFCLWI